MPSAQTTTLYRRSDGKPLAIRDGNLIGSGGEGAIYTVGTLPNLVAKVYHRPSATIGTKLTLMVDNPPNMPTRVGHVSIAWPLDTLHSAPSARPDSVVGFLMHKVRDMRPVSQCYNPAARKRHFPHYTYKHLCTVAVNIAIAVDAIHDRNYVIGDINESNIMVNDNGLVTLIDTDSFQVIDQSDGTVHRSPVGKPEYTPRELQGHSFDTVDRNLFHDRFGLGVIIYQLLMEGLHPYSGRYTGPREPPAIEDNIASGHFLHCENRAVPLVDGPGFARWDTLDESIRELFRLCFERGHDNRIVRPAPAQWEEAITRGVNSFAGCAQNSNHMHFGHNTSCPWCERRDMLRGRDPFSELLGPEPLLMGGATDQHAPAPGVQATTPAPRPRQRPTLQRTQASPEWRRVRKIVFTTLAMAPVLAILGTVVGLWPAPWDDPPPPAPAAVPPPADTPTATPPAAAAPSDPSTSLPALPGSVESAPTPSPTPLLPPTPVPPTPDASSPVPVPAVAVVETHFLADLVVEDGDIGFDPPNSSVGDTVTFTVTVTNQGEADAGSSKLRYTLARSVKTVFVGDVDVPAIPKGGSESVFFEWTADAGVHIVTVEADPTDQVHETSDIDNNKAQLHYNGTLLADLVVESIGWSPDAPIMGETVTFPVTVRNQGKGNSGAFTVEMYVDDGLIGEAELPPILPGDSEMVSFTWDAQAGPHNLNALADSGMGISEADEANNETAKTFEATRFSDLVVEAVSWEPLNPSVGDEVNFWVTVRNQGTLQAAESVVELSRTSRDGASSSSKGQVSGIPAGESATATFQWQAEPGVFSLIARADVDGVVGESDEDNNEYTIDYDATALADLTVADISWKPDRPAIGEDVTVTATLKNAGGGAAQDSGVRLFIDDAEHGEAATLTRLYPQDSGTVSFGWTAETGMHTFRVDVDHDNQVVESDEENNASETFEYDHTRLADLNVKEIDWEPDKPSVGDTVTFGVVIENLGEASARGFQVSFEEKYGAWQPMEETVSEEIAAGQTDRVSFEWPADADPHQFVVVADSREEVIESNEDNNKHTVEYSATALADLIVADIAWEPNRPDIDEEVTVTVTLKNAGDGDALASEVRLFIDDNEHGEPSALSKLSANDSATVSFTWIAEVSMHTFSADVDHDGQVVESDETNNASEPFAYDHTMLADLTVVDIAWEPERPVIGEEVTVAVTLKNAGEGDALDSEVRLFIDDIEHGEAASLPRLTTQDSGTVSFDWIAEIGAHTFSADIDHDDRVVESDETNNASGTFQYDHTRVADLIVRGINWEPENPSVGETVTFGVEVENVGEATAEDFHVRFGDESSVWQPIEKVVSDDLAPGQIFSVYFEWPADAYPHQFVVVADSREVVIESSEDNNEHTVEFGATIVADLVVSNITWSPSSPFLDQKVTIKVTVRNMGQGDSDQFIVSLSIDGTHDRERRVDGLDAGQPVEVRFGWDAEAGPHRFTATADSEGAIAETEEGNNIRSVEYDDTALADLTVQQEVVSVNPESPSAGDNVTIGLTVLNRSRVSSGRFTVSLYVDGSSQPYSSSSIGSLDSRDESAYVRFTWQAVGGCHRLLVIVDSGDDVTERDEDNNQVGEFEICVSAGSGS